MMLFHLRKGSQEKQIEKSYMTLRQTVGVLGMFLPFAVVFFAAVFGGDSNPVNCFSSISATYHTNAGDIFVGLLFCVGLFLITYDGYDRQDNIVTTISGIAAICIAFFPCTLAVLQAEHAKVGIFHLPIAVSNIIHLICAGSFFMLLAYNSAFLFTKTGVDENGDKLPVSDAKKRRNIIYVTCGIIMFAGMLLDVLAGLYITLFVKNITMEDTPIAIFLETIMLIAFGFSWLVKGEAISPLNDKN